MAKHWIGYLLSLSIGFVGGYWVKSDVPMESQSVPTAPDQAANTDAIAPRTSEADYQPPSDPESQTAESKNDAAAKLEMLKSLTLQQAIDLAKPDMEDIQGGGVSKGAAVLAYWAIDGLKWNELLEIPKGKYGLVMKDSASQLGYRLCVSGQVIEIERDRSVERPIYTGGMFDDGGRIYRFVAVGSTGEIVANTRAGFCGIVTGQQHYPNSAGGMAHAVQLVGIFDLPENKPTEVKKKGTKI